MRSDIFYTMKRIVLLANPVCGQKKGLEVLKQVLPVFKESRIEVETVVTQQKGYTFNYLKESNLHHTDAVVAIGGDGTFHEVINGMMNRGDGWTCPLGLIPAGTGNSLMHDLDLLDPIDAARAICRRKTCQMDLMKITMNDGNLYSFNVIGWGVPTDINRTAENLRWLGGWRYNLAAIVHIMINKSRKIKLTFEDETIEGDLSFLVACNTVYTGNGMRMAPEASFDDGLIDLLIAGKVGRPKLLNLLSKVFKGRHLPNPAIRYVQVPSFEIFSEHPWPLNVDGELTGNTPCTISVEPGRITFFTDQIAT